MTTVAYKDGILAADTKCATGCSSDSTRKIYRLKSGGLFGYAGSAGYGALVYEWLCGGARPKQRPKLLDGDDGIEAIVIAPNGDVSLMDNYLAPIPITGGATAIGSGGDKARALMRTGMGAEEAVRFIIAEELDNYTGGETQTLRLRQRRKKGIRR